MFHGSVDRKTKRALPCCQPSLQVGVLGRWGHDGGVGWVCGRVPSTSGCVWFMKKEEATGVLVVDPESTERKRNLMRSDSPRREPRGHANDQNICPLLPYEHRYCTGIFSVRSAITAAAGECAGGR